VASTSFKLSALVMTLGMGLAQAQTTPLEFKFASSAPPTSPWAKQIDRTAAQVAEETKGAVKITPFYGSQLGSENDAIAQISRGRIDMGSFTANSVALQVPEIALLQLPFFFDSQAQRDCVLDNHVQKHTVEALAKKNLVFINWGEVGSVHLPGKKAYATPADVKGIKVGVVANKMTADFWRAMGANPIPTNVAEATSSSQTGLIDTYPTPFAFYVPSGLNKVLPTMTKLPLWESAGVTLMNKGIYDKMPADLRASFDAGARKTPVSTLRAEIRGVDTALTAAHKQAGGTVVEATPEQRAEWSKGLASVWAAIAKDIGPDGEKYLALMDAGKKACPK
jgi:TRAP-type C4-dicarboxylate transport system substrate-binding protein